MTKHEGDVLMQLVRNPDTFKMKDAENSLDMSRMGTINKIKNLALEELRAVHNSVDKGGE